MLCFEPNVHREIADNQTVFLHTSIQGTELLQVSAAKKRLGETEGGRERENNQELFSATNAHLNVKLLKRYAALKRGGESDILGACSVVVCVVFSDFFLPFFLNFASPQRLIVSVK